MKNTLKYILFLFMLLCLVVFGFYIIYKGNIKQHKEIEQKEYIKYLKDSLEIEKLKQEINGK